MNKRWYDVDPTVSLAVSLMRNANIMTQYKCADYIVSKSKEHGIDLSENILTWYQIPSVRRYFQPYILRPEEAFPPTHQKR